jgi:hypothetical protein
MFAFLGRYGSSGPIFPPTATLTKGDKIARALCLVVSAWLIAQLWRTHPHDRFSRKLLWSLILLVPVIGWVFYGAWYTPLPPRDDSPGPFFDGTSPENK